MFYADCSCQGLLGSFLIVEKLRVEKKIIAIKISTYGTEDVLVVEVDDFCLVNQRMCRIMW